MQGLGQDSREEFLGDMIFRRQFLLGPEYHEINRKWKYYDVNDRLRLSVHPDLPCVRVEEGCRSLTLLGYILDPRHPKDDDHRILEKLLFDSGTLEDMLSAFDPLTGRWAVIYLEGEKVVIFHDPAGMRQIYYGCDGKGRLWGGSSASLVARMTGSEPDNQHLQQMVRDGVINPGIDYFWPGDSSEFLGVRRLLPNHYLDVTTRKASRFWPQLPIHKLSEDEGIARCAATLSGAISAAAARFPLALSITAGLDSRLLLAASRGVTDKLSFYTCKRLAMSSISPDIRVPKKMLKDLGLNHSIIRLHRITGGPVRETLLNTFFLVNDNVISEIAALIENPPREDKSWVTVNGNVCEIARTVYCEFVRAAHKQILMTPENLAFEARMGNCRFVEEQFGAWLENARQAIESSGINPWDLFYWEQKMGAWLGKLRTEFDLAEEVFSPYNCRSLIVDMLGVDESLRWPPKYIFFRNMISHLWPQLLKYPINPKDHARIARNKYKLLVDRMKELAKAGVQRAGLYPLYFYLRQRKQGKTK
jgi:hypothetical protein